ncbi:MAG: hypothetical protein ABID61_00625 [Candidatus Micrarchaeota archaeon]
MTSPLKIQCAGASPTLRPKFRPASVLAEGIRVLQDNEVSRIMFRMSYLNPQGILSRYYKAKKALQEFGGVVELVQVYQGAIRIAARLEFLTDHLRLDEDLHNLVVGMGFNLVLRHNVKPVEEHVYILSESRYQSTSEFSSVASITENLLRLTKMLEQYTVELPDNVVQFPVGTKQPIIIPKGAFEDRSVALRT